MLSAIQTSLSGLLSASNRAQIAADKIVKATATGSQAVEAASLASGNKAYGAAVVVGAPAAPDNDGDLIEGFLDLDLAATAYKANAVALRTADETLGKFLDSVS